jgi:hypothetical protein
MRLYEDEDAVLSLLSWRPESDMTIVTHSRHVAIELMVIMVSRLRVSIVLHVGV